MDFELYQESAVGKPSLVDEQAQVLRGLTLAVGGNDTEQFGEPEMNQLVRVVESIEMDMESVVGYSPAPTDGSGRSAKAEGRDVWADVMELAQST